MAVPFANDRTFRAYVQALLRHHALLSEGKDNGAQVEVVEDRMSALWPQLDEGLQREIRGISSDLNWLRRGYTPPPKGRRKEDVTWAELEEFQRLNEAAHVDKSALLPLLHAVRACASALEDGLVALCRARCYVGLELPELSEPFLKATIDLTGHHSEACRAAFVMLVHVSPAGAFQKAVDVIDAPLKYPPVVVAYSIQFFVEFLGGDPAAVSRDKLAEELRQAAGRLDDEPTPHEDRVTFYSLAGAQLMSFGFVDDGIKYLDEGLKLEPENAELLGWLGEAVYGQDRKRGVELFKRSILGRTRLVRPWLHLANHFLVERDFERAKAYAAHAADMARDNFSLAYALEIMAIGMSETGEPHQIVLGLLRRAHGLAPSNKRIAHNLQSFERFIQSKAAPTPWETEEQPAISETRERWRADDRRPVTA